MLLKAAINHLKEEEGFSYRRERRKKEEFFSNT